MSLESSFDQLGVDILTATRLMEILDMSPEEFQSPSRFSKLQSVISYLKQFPEDTQRFLITRATRGKNVDRLNHIYEYTSLLREKEEREQHIASIDKERSAIELSADPILQTEVAHRALDARQALNHVKEEIAIYER